MGYILILKKKFEKRLDKCGPQCYNKDKIRKGKVALMNTTNIIKLWFANGKTMELDWSQYPSFTVQDCIRICALAAECEVIRFKVTAR